MLRRVGSDRTSQQQRPRRWQSIRTRLNFRRRMRWEDGPEIDVPGAHGSAGHQVQRQRRTGLGHVSRKLVRYVLFSPTRMPLFSWGLYPSTHIPTKKKNRDRSQPVGYKVSLIDFIDGEPVAPSTSNASYADVFTNADNSKCPGACFRPVGMTFDRLGRLFVSSDASGEVYVLVADDDAVVGGGGNSSSNATASVALG